MKSNLKLKNSYADRYIFINRQSNEKIITKSSNTKEANKVLSSIILLSLLTAIGATSTYVLSKGKKAYDKQLDEEISTSVIKEASILEINNNSINRIKLDTNGNGKFDNGDNSISGIYNFKLPDDAETIVFLDNIAGTKPLAYSTKNKEYILIDKPSEYYASNKKANNLDEKFKNFIENKEMVKIR